MVTPVLFPWAYETMIKYSLSDGKILTRATLEEKENG